MNILAFILGGVFYIKGETDTRFLGKTDKIWKYTMGIPIGLCCLPIAGWWALGSILTYFLASWALPYGENSPITKLFGKSGACGIHGAGVGAASVFIIGWWAVLGAIIGGVAFYCIHKLDDAGKVKEPWVAIYRAITGLVLLTIGGVL